ncbi:MAG: DUF3298 and DUF4163 domain-containing protein [Lachnospiraceae bacterium]|nr:DUF3298 and DUF4163 domain-containing protein [Lachnospiraceae bacterium]
MKKKQMIVCILCLMLAGCGQTREVAIQEVDTEKTALEERALQENSLEESVLQEEKVVIEGYTEEGTEFDSIFGQTELLTYKFQMPEIEMQHAEAEESVRYFIEYEKEIFTEQKSFYYWDADELYRGNQMYEDESFPLPAYSYEVAYTVTQSDERYISLLKQEYIYSGGAHGNSLYTGIVLDAQTGEVLELDDFLPGLKNERIYLAQYLAEQLAPNMEGLWENYEDIVVYDVCYQPNFYIEGDALCFPFDAYELGSYAAGPQFAQIPLEKLTDLENMVSDTIQSLVYAKRLMLPEAMNGYLVEIPVEKVAYADLDGDGIEEEIWFQAAKEEDLPLTLNINGIDFPIYVDACMVQEYIGLVDINASDGKYELAVYANGMSDDPVTAFYRYADGGLCEIGRTEHIFDRAGRIAGDSYIFGDGQIYGKRRTYLPLETRWVDEYWTLIEETDTLICEGRDYYPYASNPYGVRQAEFPYWLHNSLVVYQDMSRDSDYCIVSGEGNRITKFMGSDDRNWLQVEILTADGLTWGWIYVDSMMVEVERDVYENAWTVIENLFAAG